MVKIYEFSKYVTIDSSTIKFPSIFKKEKVVEISWIFSLATTTNSFLIHYLLVITAYIVQIQNERIKKILD